MKEWTDEELVELSKKKLDLNKLKDKNVVLHPEISKWRSAEKPDLQLLRSLNNHGQIQAITFRRKNGKLELLAGSRRYAHLKLLGLSLEEMKTDIREELSDREALVIALSENFFRKDLTPMEEARAVNSILKTKMPIREVAKMLNKSQSWVRSRKNLFELPEKVRKVFEAKKVNFGYSIPLRKLKGMEKAQLKILANITSRDYGRITTVEEAEERVQGILAEVKRKEELLAKYGSCPKCGSGDIAEARWGDGNKLTCEACEYAWHKETKDPWEYYQLKQQAQELGLNLELEGPEGAKLTPAEVTKVLERQEKKAAEEKEEALPDKFRCKLPLLRLLLPMVHHEQSIEGDNIQKLVVNDDNIEIQLIEGFGLRFNGLRKDYVAGEKCRIEVSSTWETDLNDMVRKVQAYIEAREQL